VAAHLTVMVTELLDYMDNCPDTPAGTEVNKFGCTLESQKKELPHRKPENNVQELFAKNITFIKITYAAQPNGWAVLF